jgi:hypothetical protein
MDPCRDPALSVEERWALSARFGSSTLSSVVPSA